MSIDLGFGGNYRSPPPGMSEEQMAALRREQEKEMRLKVERTAFDDVLAFYNNALPDVIVKVESKIDACNEVDFSVSILVNKDNVNNGEPEKWVVVAHWSGATSTAAAIAMLSGMTWERDRGSNNNPIVRQGGPIYRAVMGLDIYHTMADDGLCIASKRTFTPE